MLVAVVLGGILGGGISIPVETHLARHGYRRKRDRYRALPLAERALVRRPSRPTRGDIWIPVVFMMVASALVCGLAWTLCDIYGPQLLYAP